MKKEFDRIKKVNLDLEVVNGELVEKVRILQLQIQSN